MIPHFTSPLGQVGIADCIEHKIGSGGNRMTLKPYVLLFIGVLSVSFAAIFIRLADAPPLVIATYRLAIASIVLLPFALIRAKATPVRKLSRGDILLILLSSIFIASHFALWITSLNCTSIASSVILVTAHPVFVAIISYFLWGERLTKPMVVGIGIALVGALFINFGSFALSRGSLLGDVLALLAALSMGIYLLIGRQLRERINILNYLALVYTCAAVILLIATVVTGYSLFGYSSTTYTMIVLLALIPQLIGHSSLNLALRLMPAIFVSVAILGEPVGATALGYFILAEAPTTVEIAGGLLVLGGIFMVCKSSAKTVQFGV